MEITYLHDFVVLAKIGNFSVAADMLNLSQSSLSKHIKSLEKELGVELFNRTSRQVSISKFGSIFLPYASKITEEYDKCTLELNKQIELKKATLSIASIPVLAQYDLTELLYDFQLAYPQIKQKVTEVESCDIFYALSNDAAELAFQRFTDYSDTGYDYLPYCTDHLVAVLPKNHPLCARNYLVMNDLRSEVMLLLDQNTYLHNICMDACHKAGYEPKMAYTGHRPENLIELTARGMGITLLMVKQAEYFKNENVEIREIKPFIKSEICLIKLKEKEFSANSKLFWQYLSERTK